MSSTPSNASTSGTAHQNNLPTTPPRFTYTSIPATPRCQHSPTHIARSAGEEKKSTSNILPICRMLTSGFQSDMKIISLGEHELKVHRIVLEMQSPVLKRMFSKDWGYKNTLIIPENFDATYWLMHHLYCGLRHLPSIEIAITVLQLADHYCIDTAAIVATEFLASRVDNETFFSILDSAALTSNTQLLRMCDQYLRDHTDEVLDEEKFPSISRVALHHIFHSSSFKPSSELLVFTSLVKWARRQPVHFILTSTESTPLLSVPPSVLPPPPPPPPSTPAAAPTLSSTPTHDPMPDLNQDRVELKEFLPHVRFLVMTKEQVIKDVMSYGILTPSEGIQLLRVMAGCKDTHLPAIASCQTCVPRNLKEQKSDTRRSKIKRDKRMERGRRGHGVCGPVVSSKGTLEALRNSTMHHCYRRH